MLVIIDNSALSLCPVNCRGWEGVHLTLENHVIALSLLHTWAGDYDLRAKSDGQGCGEVLRAAHFVLSDTQVFSSI